MDQIMVSIRCITYNHALYLRNALDSFINQRTNFKYEIIVHDDASTDGTTDILREYEARYHDLLRVFYEEKNLHSQGLLTERMNEIDIGEVRAKYIAYCEGDDFWIDNNKLQIQIDYMEQHPECAMTGHNVLIMDSRHKTVIPMDGFNTEQDVITEEIILNSKGGFQTSSFVMRTEILEQHIKLLEDCAIADWPLKLVASTFGRIHYFDRVMSVYRYCNNGAWTDRIKKNAVEHLKYSLGIIRYFKRFDEYTHMQYSRFIDDQINAIFLEIISYNKKLTMDEFHSLCNTAVQYNAQNSRYMKHLIDLKNACMHADQELIDFIKKYEKIYIMGTGQYAEELADQLNALNVTYDGFVVSNDQALKEGFFGKNVYHLKDISDNADHLGILIAIKRNLKEIIERSIESNHIHNYYWPLL